MPILLSEITNYLESHSVSNYAALPPATSVPNQLWYAISEQGTKWLLTYQSAGWYFSDGSTWTHQESPFQASQIEVNAGVVTDKFVSPATLFNSSQWATKQNIGNYITDLTGDGTASGPGSITFTLATVNSNIGTFNNVTVNAKGLVTAASNISYLTSNQTITLSGDISGSGSTSIIVTIGAGKVTNAMLVNSSITINGTAISLGASGTVTAAAGTLTGTTLNATVVTSSLTSLGTIGTGLWQGTKVAIAYGGTNSSTALSNNRIIISSSGAIVEHSAQTAGLFNFYDSNGLPSGSSNALSYDSTGQTINLGAGAGFSGDALVINRTSKTGNITSQNNVVAGKTYFLVINSAANKTIRLQHCGSSFGSSGPEIGDTSQLLTFGTGNDLQIGTGGTAALNFWTGSTKRGSITSGGLWRIGDSSAGTALLHLAAGTATANTAPFKFTSGTNLTTAEAGVMEYNGTNLFFTRSGTTRENILIGNDAAAAPSTSVLTAFTNYYGTGGTVALSAPNSWTSVVISGTTYKIPLYT